MESVEQREVPVERELARRNRATEEYLGSVLGDLRQRRAQVQDVADRSGAKVIDARVPLRRMFGYSTDLRSLTKGRATFTMQFHSYDALE